VFLKPTRKTVRGKTYTNHLLVESITTPAGPRHRTICSLGSLEPAPREHWLALAHKLEAALSGQQSLLPDTQVDSLCQRVQAQPPLGGQPQLVRVIPDQIEIQEAREAGSVYVAHQMWRRLKLDAILQKAGLNQRARLLTEVMTINRLVAPASEHAMPEWVRRTGAPSGPGRPAACRLQALERRGPVPQPRPPGPEGTPATRDHRRGVGGT